MGFTPNKKNANDFNGGVQYKNGDSLQAESLNHIIEGLLYAQENGNGGGSGETGADGRMGAIQLLLEYDGENGFGYHLYVLKCLDPTVQEEDFDGMVGLVGLVVKKTSNDVDNNLSIGDIVSITGVKDRHLVCNTDDGGEVFGNIRGEKGDKGDTGADGKTPVKGVDYFTEADKEEIAAQAAAKVDLSDYAKTSDISSHNTSTSAHADIREEISQLSQKKVVLYGEQTLTEAQKAQARTNIGAVSGDEVMETLVNEGVIPKPVDYTNLVPNSVNKNGDLYNSCGYLNNYCLNFTGEAVAKDDAVVTGFMPYTHGSTIRVTGSPYYDANSSARYWAVYDTNKALISAIKVFALISTHGATFVRRTDGMYELTVNTSKISAWSNAKFFRLSEGRCYGRDLIVTVNEEIEEV